MNHRKSYVLLVALGAIVLLCAFSIPAQHSETSTIAPPLKTDRFEQTASMVQVAKGVRAYSKTGAAALGQIQGSAIDPRREQPIPDIDVDFQWADGTPIDTVLSDVDGKFTFADLDFGDYRIVIDDPFYRRLDLYFTVDSDTLMQLPPAWCVPEPVIDIGDIGGEVLNAVTGEYLVDVDLEFRKGIDPPISDPVVAQTLTTGTWIYADYSVNDLEAGVYTAFASKQGFHDGRFHIYVLGAEKTAPQNGALSPLVLGDDMRIILTWGAKPRDLDSHLWAPNPFGGGKVHLYYAVLGTHPWGAWFDLDRDDVLRYGPETTTIRQWEPETYCFHVQNFSHKNLHNSTSMSNSGAKVTVLTATETTDFYITPDTEGTAWGVFTVDGATQQITPLNTYYYQSNETLVGYDCLLLNKGGRP